MLLEIHGSNVSCAKMLSGVLLVEDTLQDDVVSSNSVSFAQASPNSVFQLIKSSSFLWLLRGPVSAHVLNRLIVSLHAAGVLLLM